MNFGDLKTMSRAYVPGAMSSKVGNTTLELILNTGTELVAYLTSALRKNTLFTVTASTYEYNLTTVSSSFLRIMREGLWWTDGDSDWAQLKARTIRWLDDNRADWRNAASSDPEFYYQDGDTLGVYPTPDTTLASGFKLYHSIKPTTMTVDTHFPFHASGVQATEIARLSILSDSILEYAKWKTLSIISKEKEEIALARKDFFEDVTLKTQLIADRIDMTEDLREDVK